MNEAAPRERIPAFIGDGEPWIAARRDGQV
jgi:hypothetical protein